MRADREGRAGHHKTRLDPGWAGDYLFKLSDCVTAGDDRNAMTNGCKPAPALLSCHIYNIWQYLPPNIEKSETQFT